jgi:electron transport complex protein RnfB
MGGIEKSTVARMISRRYFIAGVLRGLLLAILGCFGGAVFMRRSCIVNGDWACGSCPDRSGCRISAFLPARSASVRRTVWQLDPKKCIQCGGCAVNCVFQPSAVKCVHHFERCGYCRLCFGFFQPGAKILTSAAENQLCPTGAIRRKFVEEPYYEYTVDESLCIGCGRCVKGCGAFGNGSLMLQVRHDLCLNCNECSIARRCPASAFSRVPADQPYLFNPAAEKKRS